MSYRIVMADQTTQDEFGGTLAQYGEYYVDTTEDKIVIKTYGTECPEGEVRLRGPLKRPVRRWRARCAVLHSNDLKMKRISSNRHTLIGDVTKSLQRTLEPSLAVAA